MAVETYSCVITILFFQVKLFTRACESKVNNHTSEKRIDAHQRIENRYNVIYSCHFSRGPSSGHLSDQFSLDQTDALGKKSKSRLAKMFALEPQVKFPTANIGQREECS